MINISFYNYTQIVTLILKNTKFFNIHLSSIHIIFHIKIISAIPLFKKYLYGIKIQEKKIYPNVDG